jgi:tRNA(Ile)-lysidine synthase
LRNRIRLRLLPELERYNPRLRSTLLRAAAAAADDYAYLEAQVLLAWPSVATESGPGSALTLDRTAFHDLHPALQRGILRKALEGVWGGWQDFGWTHLESARLALLKGRVGTVVDLPHGLSLTVGYHAATLAAGPLALESDLPTLSVDSLPLTVPGVTPLPGGPWRLEILPADIPAPLSAQPAAPRTALVDADAVGASLLLRRPRPGDRYQPLGMAGTKKLQDLLVDAKVPRQLRAGLPVLASQRGIVWVAGRWLADWARVSAATRQAWRVRFIRED